MLPETALLLARYRLAVTRRPELLARAPWYRVEGERIQALAVQAGVDPARAVQAAAVLSPAVQWESLVDRLPAFLAAFARAAHVGIELNVQPPTFPGYGPNVRKAWRVLAGLALPTGPKVSRFARNLAGDERPVTVDRWAARAAGLPDGGGAAWYRRIETAYRELARHVGLPPSRVQAILWAAVRERIVQWGPVLDGGLSFGPFDGAVVAPGRRKRPALRRSAPSLTGESTERSPSPDASQEVYGDAILAGPETAVLAGRKE